MKQIILENLHCTDSEDFFGDECRLEVYCDGELHFAHRRDMDDGDDWPIGAKALFESTCTLRLYDEDLPFPGGDDDVLGQVTVGDLVTSETAVFDQEGAHYTLTYSVVDRPDITAEDLASFAAEQFEQSERGGLWAKISKKALAENLRERRQSALEIDQERSNFCGPTSIVYELARTQPRRYIELSRQLYETGGFWSRTKRVEATEKLMADDIGQKMDPADWMLIATMRNAENTLFKVEAAAKGLVSGLQGMTHPWEIKGWAEEILLKEDVEVDTCFVAGELDAIKAGHAAWEAGGSAFILLNMAILKSGERDLPPWPDHWVVYQGGLEIDDDRVAYNVYSWGRIIELDLTRKRFEKSLFTVVTAV